MKKFLLDEVTKICRANDLKGFEIPKALYVHNELFSVENDLLTPTFKLKRPIASKYFAEQIKQMYG